MEFCKARGVWLPDHESHVINCWLAQVFLCFFWPKFETYGFGLSMAFLSIDLLQKLPYLMMVLQDPGISATKATVNRVAQELFSQTKSALEERQLREKLESENKQEVFQRQRELQKLGQYRCCRQPCLENCTAKSWEFGAKELQESLKRKGRWVHLKILKKKRTGTNLYNSHFFFFRNVLRKI